MGIDRNSKEAFVKKLQICMKHYDYKDETKDVRGKVTFSFFLLINFRFYNN